MKRDDSLWKVILEKTFDDFLRFFIPDADEVFDFNRKFQFLDKELEQLFPTNPDDFSPMFVDKLVKVFTKNGTGYRWILVHIEVQGSKDKHFSERMFSYFYRIFEKYKMPITAFAILADNNKNFKPTCFEYNFLGTELRYSFNTCKILELDDNELLASKNLFASVALTAKTALKKGKVHEKNMLELKVNLLKRLVEKQIPRQKIHALMNFLKLYIRFSNEKLNAKYEEIERIITDKPNTIMEFKEFVIDRAKRMGRMEGRMEGERKGKLEEKFNLTKTLLETTDFDESRIALLVKASLDFVQKVKAGVQIDELSL